MKCRSSDSVQIPAVSHQIIQAVKQISISPQSSRCQENRQSPQGNQAKAKKEFAMLLGSPEVLIRSPARSESPWE